MEDISASGARHETDGQDLPPSHAEQNDGGHSGEGAASALAHLKSQARQHRHQSAEADDAAGGGHGQ
jgi:hypothetical protein